MRDYKDKSVRLELYKTTLNFLETETDEMLRHEKYGYGINSGICIILGCLVFEKHYLGNWIDERGIEKDWGCIASLFPEFGVRYKSYSGNIDKEWRIETLKSCIKQLS